MAVFQNLGVKLETRTTKYLKCFNSDYDERMFVFADGNKVYKTVFSLNFSKTIIQKIQFILELELEDFVDRYFLNESNLLSKVHTDTFHIEVKTCLWCVPEEFKRLSLNGKPLNFVQTEYIFYVSLCPKLKSIFGMSEKFEDAIQQNFHVSANTPWEDANVVTRISPQTSSLDGTDCEDSSDWSHLSESDDEKSELSTLFRIGDLPRQSDEDYILGGATDSPDDKTESSASSPRIFLVTKVEETGEATLSKSISSEVPLISRPVNETTSQFFFSPLASSSHKVEVENIDFMDNAEKLISGSSSESKDGMEKDRHNELFPHNVVPKIVEFAQSEETLYNFESVSLQSATAQSDEMYQQDKKKGFGWGLISKLFGK